MNYTHLTQDERYQIAILDKAGHEKSDIARVMNRDKSTIGREMARNRGKRGYRPKQAHEFSQARMACENGPRIAAETWAVVEGKLAETWSPEQISGHLKAHSQPTVSHEAIYPRIYADKSAGGTLHLALRCQKVRKKRYGDAIDAVSFAIKCPSIAPRHRGRPCPLRRLGGRPGYWRGAEAGARHDQRAHVPLSLIAHVPFKTAQAVSAATISLLTPFAASVHTITTDNGREFAQHEQIAKQLGADFFFAHPYSSWERGANENMNGLIRAFFPKKMAFESIATKDIEFAMYRLNHRPRKCLGYKTPHEVFMNQLHLAHNPLALQS